MNEITQPLAQITNTYRRAVDQTYRGFAELLNEHLVNTNITYASVMNWERGMTVPNTDLLLVLLMVHGDWRRQFAIDCLCAKLPEVFERADGGIRILAGRGC